MGLHKSVVPLLACPVCRGELESRIDREDANHIFEGGFICEDCKRTYPIVDSIAIFLDGEEKRDDFWKEQETFAARFRREHPIRYFLLTKTFLGNIKPEHHFLKGLILENENILEKATKRIYTKEYLIGYEKTKKALFEIEKDDPSIILEIACGRGSFFKAFLQSRKGRAIYVASDFSLTILRNNLKWLRTRGFQDHVTLMVLDAKAVPFRDSCVPAVTSNLGFPNIRNDGKAVREAFRVLIPRGVLITNFMFTTESTRNYAKASEISLEQFYTRNNVESLFRESGFKFTMEELHRGLVRPTPGGIDMLPIVQDVYSFCVARATKPGTATSHLEAATR
jgi:ubiquinone/menaquinone biosynthesis C-methylase UbiE/uncharacterized protein YbaR (Trm112 family)